MKEAEHLRYTDLNKEIYAQRKETIEQVFADMKEKHGMRCTTLKGLKKVSAQVMLVAACMNLKKMANWLWKSPEKPDQEHLSFFTLETVFVFKQKIMLKYLTLFFV